MEGLSSYGSGVLGRRGVWSQERQRKDRATAAGRGFGGVHRGTETKRGLKAAQKNRLHTEGMEKKEESSDAEGQAPGH